MPKSIPLKNYINHNDTTGFLDSFFFQTLTFREIERKLVEDISFYAECQGTPPAIAIRWALTNQSANSPHRIRRRPAKVRAGR
jgi:hypothetical protein